MTPSTVLVTGAAGYIGAHMVKLLLTNGAKVVGFDDLSSGRREAIGGVEFVQGDITRAADLAAVFQRFRIDAVIHFASRIQVGESMQRPADYYRTNVHGTLQLLDAMRDGELDGMQHFDGELEKLLRAGVISRATALLYATNQGNLQLQIADIPPDA